jgi:hypothetical protein
MVNSNPGVVLNGFSGHINTIPRLSNHSNINDLSRGAAGIKLN